MVGLGRLELPTSRLSGVRSNQAELQARNTNSRGPQPLKSSPATHTGNGLGSFGRDAKTADAATLVRY